MQRLASRPSSFSISPGSSSPKLAPRSHQLTFTFRRNQAPIVGWASAYIIVTLILGVALVPAFFYMELRISPNPILPVDVFTMSNAFVLGCIACGWGNFGIWVSFFEDPRIEFHHYWFQKPSND